MHVMTDVTVLHRNMPLCAEAMVSCISRRVSRDVQAKKMGYVEPHQLNDNGREKIIKTSDILLITCLHAPLRIQRTSSETSNIVVST